MNRLWRAIRAVVLLQLCLYCGLARGQAVKLDLTSTNSIKTAARQLAESAMAFYDGEKPGGIPGLLPPSAAGEFNWWEAGALFGQMVEYWHLTGDDTWNDVTKRAILFQVGPDNNFEPINQTRTEGNDDQAFWAFAAMSAAEAKFPDPSPKEPQWLALAQAVFNRQAARWDDNHCGGGLRWQFNPLNNGYTNKNTISNGCFFQLAARLARYTGNQTYARWAEKTYDWMWQSPLIDKQSYEVYDSLPFDEQSCPSGDIGLVQWTYNVGTIIAGAAHMYNYTNGDPKWKERLNGYLGATQKIFFPSQYGGKILTEYACETQDNCNKDQRSFKAYLARWLAITVQVAPYTAGQILPWLQTSAQAAVKQCSGTTSDPGGVACGRKWYADRDDGSRDVGNQMCTMSIVQANLILKAAPLANSKTGTSAADPSAGNGKDRPLTNEEKLATRKMTTGDKAGAWILTVIMVLAIFAWALYVLAEDLGIEDWIYGGYNHNPYSAARGSTPNNWYGR